MIIQVLHKIIQELLADRDSTLDKLKVHLNHIILMILNLNACIN